MDLREQVMRTGGGWNYFRIMFKGRVLFNFLILLSGLVCQHNDTAKSKITASEVFFFSLPKLLSHSLWTVLQTSRMNLFHQYLIFHYLSEMFLFLPARDKTQGIPKSDHHHQQQQQQSQHQVPELTDC